MFVVVQGNDDKYYYVQLRYDTRVRVSFQDNAWCDEQIMRRWIIQQWKPACSGHMLLVLDVHKAQTTEAIQDCLKEQWQHQRRLEVWFGSRDNTPTQERQRFPLLRGSVRSRSHREGKLTIGRVPAASNPWLALRQV